MGGAGLGGNEPRRPKALKYGRVFGISDQGEIGTSEETLGGRIRPHTVQSDSYLNTHADI